jgi:hypothetical protein
LNVVGIRLRETAARKHRKENPDESKPTAAMEL